MAISKQRRVLPLGSLLQNEPHLRRHTLTLARNAHFNWSEALAINGSIGLLDGQSIVPVGGAWPDGAQILARTERPDYGGTTSPWVIQAQARDCSIWIEFPDIPIAPVEVFPYTAGWGFAALELDLPVGVWHRAILTVDDIEPGAVIAWVAWGERPLTAADLVPPSAAPSNTLAPVIFGDAEVGETLTCSPPGSWSGFPVPTYAYQWYQAPSTSIMGANAFRYTVQAGDAGLDLFCRVTATNTAGSADADSNTLGPVASGAVAPVNTFAPVTSGTVRIGEVLSCTTGTWTGTPTPTYAYQWRRDGVDIGGATASTHTVVGADMATEIDCVVTATNVAGADSEPSNTLASPWQPILAARPGVLIWDGLDPQCYGGASVGAPVAELRTVDGVTLGAQAITTKQATRTSATLDFDGADDFYNGNATYADYWGVSQTYVIGVDGLSVGANEFAIDANGGLISPAKQAIIAGSANIARNQHRSLGDTGAAMLGLATADQDLAVVWVTGTPGSGTLYDLASGVSVANSCAPASLPSRVYTQWSLGGNIAGSATWQGNLRYLGVDGTAWSAGDLATWRACALAAGVL